MLTVATLNVWSENGEPAQWPRRRVAIESALRAGGPLAGVDVDDLQECHPTILAAIDATLGETHARIDDNERWTHEGNIYWRTDTLELVESGEACAIGICWVLGVCAHACGLKRPRNRARQ